MKNVTVEFKGASGRSYKYWVYPMGTGFADKAGNYSFAWRKPDKTVKPLYFGETSSLRDRVTGDHEKLPCARRYGANVICAHVNEHGRNARLAEEADLRAKYRPPCNDQ